MMMDLTLGKVPLTAAAVVVVAAAVLVVVVDLVVVVAMVAMVLAVVVVVVADMTLMGVMVPMGHPLAATTDLLMEAAVVVVVAVHLDHIHHSTQETDSNHPR